MMVIHHWTKALSQTPNQMRLALCLWALTHWVTLLMRLYLPGTSLGPDIHSQIISCAQSMVLSLCPQRTAAAGAVVKHKDKKRIDEFFTRIEKSEPTTDHQSTPDLSQICTNH